MVVAQIAAKFRSGDVQAARILDSGVLTVHGRLNRESALANTLDTALMNSQIRQVDGSVYWIVCSAAFTPVRFYRAYPDAVLLRLTADPAGPAVTAGQTGTGGTSGESFDVVEDYITGDLFVVADNPTGNFSSNETINFSGGGTATLTVAGFEEDNGGEWAIDFATTNTTLNTAANHSGLHYAIMPSGAAGLCAIFQTGGLVQVTVTFDPTLGIGFQWTETTRGGASAPFGQVGGSIVHNNTLFWSIRSSGSTNRGIHFFNPQTDVAGFFLAPFDRDCADFCSIAGRIFVIGETGASLLSLFEVTPGAAVLVDTVPSGAGNDRWNIPNAAPPCLFRGEDDGALYAIESINQVAGINRQVARWVIDAVGTIQRTGPIQSGQAELDIGEALLPAVRRSNDVIAGDFWKKYRDIETTPGTPEYLLYWFQSPAIAGLQYRWAGWTDLVSGNPVTWDGTTTVQFPAPHGLVIGNWIRHNPTNLDFRVVATPSGTEAEIDNTLAVALGFSIPNTAAVTSVMNALTAVPPTGLIVAYDMPNEQVGGGDTTYTPNEKHPDLIGTPTDVSGGERQTWLGYNGVGPCQATGWYMRPDGVILQMNLANADQGGALPIIGNAIQGVIADGVTPFEVDWLSEGQGIQPGEIVARWFRIFT